MRWHSRQRASRNSSAPRLKSRALARAGGDRQELVQGPAPHQGARRRGGGSLHGPRLVQQRGEQARFLGIQARDRVVAQIVQVLGEAVSARPGGGVLVHPAEVAQALVDGPAARLGTQGPGQGDLLLLGGRALQQFQRLTCDRGRLQAHQKLAQFAVREVARVREQRVETLLDARGLGALGIAEADADELEGAQGAEQLVLTEFLQRQLLERIQGSIPHRRRRAARDRDQALDRRPRARECQRARGPGQRVTQLEPDAPGVAEEPVIRIEEVDAHRRVARLALDDEPRHPASRVRPLLVLPAAPGRVLGVARRLAADPVQGRLRAPSAHQEVQGSVGPEFHVRDRQGLAFDQRLERAAVGGAVLVQRHGVDLPVGPVADQESAPIRRVKVRALGHEAHARRGRGADVDDARQAVGVVRGPAPRARAPAVVAARDHVFDHRRAIPGQAHVPLHVGVEREGLAVLVERHVVGVAEAGGEELPLPAVRIRAADPTAGRDDADRVAVGIGVLGQQLVLAPALRHERTRERARHLRVVAADDVERALVRREHDRVGTVLTVPLEGLEQLGLAEAVVAAALGAPQAGLELAAAVGDDHVQRVEGVQQSVRASGQPRELLDARHRAVREGHAVQRAVLVAGEDATAVVEAHRDPGALGALRHAVEQLGAETLRQLQFLGGERAHGGEQDGRRSLAPHAGAQIAQAHRRLPGSESGLLGRPRVLGGGEPGRVAGDAARGAVGEFQVQGAVHARRAALVLGADRNRVVTRLEVLCHVGVDGRFPIVVLQHARAVDVDLEEVVGGTGQSRGRGQALQAKALLEARDLVLARVLAGPDPLRPLAAVGLRGAVIFRQEQVLEAHLHRRALVELEGQQAAGGEMRRIEVGDAGHRHAVDGDGDGASARDDRAVVPLAAVHVVQEARAVGQIEHRLGAVGVEAHRLTAPRAHAPSALLVEATGPIRSVLEVGLVAGHPEVALVPAAELHAGISAREAVVEFQLEVGGQAAAPQEPGGALQRPSGGRATHELAVLDAPAGQVALEVLERGAVENRPRRLCGGRGGEEQHSHQNRGKSGLHRESLAAR
jgi:hypothetical protein